MLEGILTLRAFTVFRILFGLELRSALEMNSLHLASLLSRIKVWTLRQAVTHSILFEAISLLRRYLTLMALISLLIHSLSFVVALTLLMCSFAASSMASSRKLIRESNDAFAMLHGDAEMDESTSFEKLA